MWGFKCSEEKILSEDPMSHKWYPEMAFVALGCQIDNLSEDVLHASGHDLVLESHQILNLCCFFASIPYGNLW